jgi:hypothetical protein
MSRTARFRFSSLPPCLLRLTSTFPHLRLPKPGTDAGLTILLPGSDNWGWT